MPTQSRTLTLDDDVIATLQTYIEKEAVDQAFEEPLVMGWMWRSAKSPGMDSTPSGLAKLNKYARISPDAVETQDGREAVIPLAFNSATTVEDFRGADVLSTAIDPVLNECFSKWAYKTGYVACTWQEKIENSGPERQLSILKARTDMLYRTMTNDLEDDFWGTQGDVLSSGSKTMPGIQAYINTSPSTGTVWGVNRATFSAWRNNADTVGSFAANGVDKMDSMFKSCSGTNSATPPSMIITTSTVQGYAKKVLQSLHRVTGDTILSADLGIPVVLYEGLPLLFTSKCPSGTMYFLNGRHLKLIKHANADWELVRPPVPNDQLIIEQLRPVIGVTWGSTRWNRFGVLSSITA